MSQAEVHFFQLEGWLCRATGYQEYMRLVIITAIATLSQAALVLVSVSASKYHKPINNKYVKRIINLYNSDLYHLLAYSLIS